MEQPTIEEIREREKARRRRLLITEAVVVTMMLGGFVFMLVESADWPFGAALFPRISGALGIATVAAYAVQRGLEELRPRFQTEGRVLDIGWTEFGGDKKDTKSRTVAFVVSTGGLWVGIWLVGFHIAIPTYLVVILLVYGRVRWYWAAAAAAAAYGLIIGVYDELLHTSWNDPVLFDFVRNLRLDA